MPLYAFHCPGCGSHFDRYLPLSRYDEMQDCTCGTVAVKRLTAPMIVSDYPGYTCPVSGKWIEGRKAHENNLRQHGCHVFESGEREAAERARQAEDTALENSVAETAARFVESLPTHKREQLGKALAPDASLTVQRLTKE